MKQGVVDNLQNSIFSSITSDTILGLMVKEKRASTSKTSFWNLTLSQPML